MQTITLTDQAHERIAALKAPPKHSFSKVILRVPKRGTGRKCSMPRANSRHSRPPRPRRWMRRARTIGVLRARRIRGTRPEVDYRLDTNFLIGCWRQPRQGPEVDFLEAHGDDLFALAWIVKGEFLADAATAGHDVTRVRKFLSPYPLALPGDATPDAHARIYATLPRQAKRSASMICGLPQASSNTGCRC